jgi:very-short-patch-repair endonuclease
MSDPTLDKKISMGSNMHFGARKELILFARKLRLNMTQAEKILWEHLRKKSFGYKFRNQHAIYRYIVDFYCHELRLIIEVDGSIHTLSENALNDKDRDQILLSLGLQIIRFTNNEISENIEKVLEVLAKNISQIESMKSPLGDLGVKK